jgi:hypothetical protein
MWPAGSQEVRMKVSQEAKLEGSQSTMKTGSQEVRRGAQEAKLEGSQSTRNTGSQEVRKGAQVSKKKVFQPRLKTGKSLDAQRGGLKALLKAGSQDSIKTGGCGDAKHSGYQDLAKTSSLPVVPDPAAFGSSVSMRGIEAAGPSGQTRQPSDAPTGKMKAEFLTECCASSLSAQSGGKLRQLLIVFSRKLIHTYVLPVCTPQLVELVGNVGHKP